MWFGIVKLYEGIILNWLHVFNFTLFEIANPKHLQLLGIDLYLCFRLCQGCHKDYDGVNYPLVSIEPHIGQLCIIYPQFWLANVTRDNNIIILVLSRMSLGNSKNRGRG